jgi:hypothetical protein
MPITAKEIITSAANLKPHPEENPDKGLYKIEPPIKLVCTVSLGVSLPKGQTVLAYLFYDEKGKYPGSIQIQGYAFWWNLEYFDLSQN